VDKNGENENGFGAGEPTAADIRPETMSGPTPHATRLYGRERLTDRLARGRSPVTVLTGDSAIGKSSLLGAAQRRSSGLGALAPAPRTLASSGAVLQNGLLESLAEVVSTMIVERGRADQVVRLITEAAKRMAHDRGVELARVVGKELLGLVRAKLGDEFGDALLEYAADLKTAAEDQLGARITAVVDPGVAGLIVDFAAEVCALAGDRNVVVAFDRGERLGQDDLRVLADLAERMPESLHLWIAVETSNTVQSARITALARAEGIARLEIGPLEEAAISTWLGDVGLDPAKASEVLRAGGGYGLHTADLIEHLLRGGEIEDAPLNEQFARRTRELLAALDPDIAAGARRLCVLTDPLPAASTERLLEVEPSLRAEMEARLREGRIFSVEVNGRPWFHEQRRRYILDELLDADERESGSARAASALFDLIVEEVSPARLGELAELVACAPGLLEADEGLATVIGLDPDQLAVAAALTELADPDHGMLGVGGDELLTYARTVFGAKGDLIEATRRLDELGLVALAEQEWRTFVAIHDWSGMMHAVLAGRAQVELGRLPVAAVGSAVFQLLISSRVEGFSRATYSVGKGWMEILGREASALPPVEPGFIVIGGDPSPSLLVRSRYGGRAMSASVSFDNGSDRDTALERLEGFENDIFGDHFAVEDLLVHPVEPVRADRFPRALKRLLKGGSPKLSEPMSLGKRVSLQAAAIRVLRSRSSQLERQALRIEDPVGLAWREIDGDSIVVVEIRGGREGAFELSVDPDLDWRTPFSTYLLAEDLDITDQERIVNQRFHLGSARNLKHPVVETVDQLSKHAASFNEAQKVRREIELDPATLGPLIEASWEERLADCAALAPLCGGLEIRELGASHVFVALAERPSGRLGFGSWGCAWASIPAPDGKNKVVVEMVDPSRLSRGLQSIPGLFGLEIEKLDNASAGGAESCLAGLLGYRGADVSFV
jgi:hypothetical protein